MPDPRPLEEIRVASPCTVSWEGMAGDDRVRHCGQCRLNVYNLSAMSRREAEALVGGREGRLCVRFFRRADGTVLTRDCPVGLAAIRRRLRRIGRAVAAAFGLVLATGCGSSGRGDGPPAPVTGTPVVAPAPPPVMGKPSMIMGDMVEPPHVQGEIEAPPGK